MMLVQSGGFSLWPESASTSAVAIDRVYLALLGLTLFFVLLIGALALGYGVKYRAGTTPYRFGRIRNTLLVELVWIGAPLVMTLVIFGWGAYVYVDAGVPPPEARPIYVVGRQWMWKVQHRGGRKEINELHVPAREPVKLASEIHLGSLGLVAAMAIAAIKALLVAAFFMHLRHVSPLSRLFAVSGLFWMAILLGLTIGDYLHR